MQTEQEQVVTEPQEEQVTFDLKHAVRFDAVAVVAWQEQVDPAGAKRVSEYLSGKTHEPMTEEHLRAVLGDELTNMLIQVATLQKLYFETVRRMSKSIAENTPKVEEEPEHENDKYL